MKKKLFYLILVSLLLTGCTKSTDQILRYSKNIDNKEYYLGETAYAAEATPFTEELCVIPEKSQNKKDKNLPASAATIINNTKKIKLYSNGIYEKLYPASITKIMTAYVALKYGNLDDTVTISHNAANITEFGAKLCGFEEGDTISLRDLLNALLIYSGNDAGIAVAEHISGTEAEFAKIMNEEARKLGAVHTHFVNAHGLHNKDHYTTVYDLYLIFHELAKNEEFLSIIQKPTITVSYKNAHGKTIQKDFPSTNRFINGVMEAPEGISVLGGKTGTTLKAGYCLILYSASKKNNDKYISVVLNAEDGDSLFEQMNYLLNLAKK